MVHFKVAICLAAGLASAFPVGELTTDNLSLGQHEVSVQSLRYTTILIPFSLARFFHAVMSILRESKLSATESTALKRPLIPNRNHPLAKKPNSRSIKMGDLT